MVCYKDEEKSLPHSNDQTGGGGWKVSGYQLYSKIPLQCCVTSVADFVFYGFFLLYEDRQLFLINVISSIRNWDRRGLKVGGQLAPAPPHPDSLLRSSLALPLPARSSGTQNGRAFRARGWAKVWHIFEHENGTATSKVKYRYISLLLPNCRPKIVRLGASLVAQW